MGHSGKANVPYLKKVDSVEHAKVTPGVCFYFGKNCNVICISGEEVGRIEYVGKHGPEMQFQVKGKKDASPTDFESAWKEFFAWKGIAMPMME